MAKIFNILRTKKNKSTVSGRKDTVQSFNFRAPSGLKTVTWSVIELPCGDWEPSLKRQSPSLLTPSFRFYKPGVPSKSSSPACRETGEVACLASDSDGLPGLARGLPPGPGCCGPCPGGGTVSSSLGKEGRAGSECVPAVFLQGRGRGAPPVSCKVTSLPTRTYTDTYKPSRYCCSRSTDKGTEAPERGRGFPRVTLVKYGRAC